jgi:hypothetical protein
MGKFIDFLTESEDEVLNVPPIAVGDSVLIGKFKNRKATVTGFGTDSKGQLVLHTTKGDQQLFKPRIVKLMNAEVDEVEEDASPRVIIDKGW